MYFLCICFPPPHHHSFLLSPQHWRRDPAPSPSGSFSVTNQKLLSVGNSAFSVWELTLTSC